MKNDPSVTKLGDIGTIFGGGPDNQIAQSVKRLGSMGKFMGGESTTKASSIQQKSKLNTAVDKYLVAKPSSIKLKEGSSIKTLFTTEGRNDANQSQFHTVDHSNSRIFDKKPAAAVDVKK